MTTSEPTTGTEPDAALTAALAVHGSPITGDQYVELVLVVRQSAWIEEHRDAYAANGVEGLRIWAPLLPDFVCDADIEHVQLPEPTPKRRAQPRQYRPASYWRDRVEKLGREMQGLSTPILNDRAAAGGAGLGPRRTRAVQARMDSRLARYMEVRTRHSHAKQMLQAAEARESCRTRA
ncbi:hypothetical protein [Prescottella agglutinans]|uniref:Uncharacterized protein n=1 Tax=Prescottella agglutinans TaxID=1644129 RepID=A0ABT6MI99_9NOCA|nr:hypothetical protein [Prescottella agglutinans]MDH6284040.1 hypothetical protein [Prescottella agglutinans]